MSARKDDQGKPPLSLIPRTALWAEARVMAHGADKYGRDNWRGGMSWSRLIDAALRHITAFADGEDIDNGEGGTGESHLANARCCLAFLIEYMEYELGEDDRHTTIPAEIEQEGELTLVTLAASDAGSALATRPEWFGFSTWLTISGEWISLPDPVFFMPGESVWARWSALDGCWDYVGKFESAA
jgi:hypothetical protein